MRYLLPATVSIAALLAAFLLVPSGATFEATSRAFWQLSWSISAAVLTIFFIASALASLRLWLIARSIGVPISGRDALAASSIGNLAGALFFQIMGQTVARAAWLARRGTSVASTIVLSTYERLLVALVSLCLGALGAWHLFGKLSLDLSFDGGGLVKFAAAGCLAGLTGAYFAWGRIAVRKFGRMPRMNLWSGASQSLALSFLIQMFTACAYLVTVLALQPELPVWDIAAASAVVMLASSIPISLAGWGVREFSAVLALGAIGLPVEKALVASLLVGTLSLVAVAIVAASVVVVGAARQRKEHATSPAEPRLDFAKVLSWILPLATATAVFFQVHLPTSPGTTLNVNLADPLAVVSAALFIVRAFQMREWPIWRLESLNQSILLVTLTLTIGLVLGWQSFGLTGWALSNKYFGWFLLLAYGATGALIVATAGGAGRAVLLRTFVASGLAICLVDILLIELRKLGVPIADGLAPTRASGFASNPNAFAFQMLLVACAVLTVVRSPRLMTASLTIIVIAIWLSASRAGLAAVVVVLAAAVVLRPDCRRAVLYGVLLSLAGIVLLQVIPSLWSVAASTVSQPTPAGETLQAANVGFGPIANAMPGSDVERWQTVSGGLSLFRESPLFGAGLGAFAESWRIQHGEIQVIHSTPVWLLAEFGLIGAAVILFPFLGILLHSFRGAVRGRRTDTLIFLICIGFSIVCLAHELLYQRAFWLLLGATLAIKSVNGRRGHLSFHI